jgi:hypothetical protein
VSLVNRDLWQNSFDLFVTLGASTRKDEEYPPVCTSLVDGVRTLTVLLHLMVSDLDRDPKSSLKLPVMAGKGGFVPLPEGDMIIFQ